MHLTYKDNQRLGVKRQKTILQAKYQQKTAGVAMLISEKADIKIKKTMRDKEGQYIMIKETFHQEDITLMNIYTPNTTAPKDIKQLLTDLKGEINSNTIIVGDLNTPLNQWMDHPDRKSTRK